MHARQCAKAVMLCWRVDNVLVDFVRQDEQAWVLCDHVCNGLQIFPADSKMIVLMQKRANRRCLIPGSDMMSQKQKNIAVMQSYSPQLALRNQAVHMVQLHMVHLHIGPTEADAAALYKHAALQVSSSLDC